MGGGSSKGVPEGKAAECLKKQNAETSAAIIALLGDDAEFASLAKYEGEAIVSRDAEDAAKLQSGVDASIAKGVLEALNPPPEYLTIDVLGKSPDDVCDAILEHMGAAKDSGGVVVLCGLSGTGKGTTVARLQERLAGKTTAWSNGNVFRSLTLLAATWCEQQGCDAFDAEKALTAENLATFMGMLEFGNVEGRGWDIKICGLGVDAFVGDIKNTDLKGPKVAANIPTVAEQTQGEVVKFAAAAATKMGDAGLIVLLEGREATVNYIPSPYRYTLTMSDTAVLGQRRAAQRVAAAVGAECGDDATDDAVAAAVRANCTKMATEIAA